MIFLKKLLLEDPEQIIVNNKEWGYHRAVGVFLIFPDKTGKLRWVFSNNREGYIGFDDGTKKDASKPDRDRSRGDIDTHGGVSHIIKLGHHIAYDDYEKVVTGRLWHIDKYFYVSFWNTESQLNSILKSSMSIVESILKTMGVNDFNRLFIEIYPEDYEGGGQGEAWDGDLMIPYKNFKLGATNKKSSDTTLDRQKKDRELHLLKAKEKNKSLKDLGVVPKVGNIPDFIRRQQRGIDENSLKLVVREIKKGL